jgi:CheY-like chemotaxis protein
VVAAAPSMTSGPLGLLIADDDAHCRSALREVFEPEGFRTFEASTGFEAIEIARVEPVHMLLMDWQMPMMTGLEAFRIIREMLGALPCILMTGNPTKELLLRAMAEKAFTVIEKPVSAGVVVYTVRRVVRQFYYRT